MVYKGIMENIIRDEKGRFIKGSKAAKGNKLKYIPRAIKNYHRVIITEILEGFDSLTILNNISNLSEEKQIYIFLELSKLENQKIDSEFKQNLEVLKLKPEPKETDVYIVDITEDLEGLEGSD
jgi:hypothetical protein